MSNPGSRVLLLHCFDAYAGAQRIGAAIVTQLRARGVDVDVKLGFGTRGFLSDLPGVSADIGSNHIPTRKLIYPLWSLAALIPVAWSAARGRTIWINAVYALLPALLATMLFPHRTVIHLHEAAFPRIFHDILKLAAWRGATIVCVSKDQARRVGVEALVLPNPVPIPVVDTPSRRNRLLFIGTTQAIKGFSLFIAVCERLPDIDCEVTAYLSDEDRCDTALVARARQAGIGVIFGERSPDAMYANGFLVLVCTDPALWTETFSLVAAEAVAHLVPVAGPGISVLPEVVGEALAFDEPDRDPARIAADIVSLREAPERHAALRRACVAQRPHLSTTAFTDRLLALLS